MIERIERLIRPRPTLGNVLSVDGGTMTVATNNGPRRVSTLPAASRGDRVSIAGDLVTRNHTTKGVPVYRV